jgi:hypothetical protein
LDAVVVDLPDRDAARNLALQSRLEQLHFECGCTAGAYALVAVLALGPIAAWLTWPYALVHTFAAISIWFLVVIGCTLSAKLIAQLRAHVFLRRIIKELDREVELNSCG